MPLLTLQVLRHRTTTQTARPVPRRFLRRVALLGGTVAGKELSEGTRIHITMQAVSSCCMHELQLHLRHADETPSKSIKSNEDEFTHLRFGRLRRIIWCVLFTTVLKHFMPNQEFNRGARVVDGGTSVRISLDRLCACEQCWSGYWLGTRNAG